MRVFLLVSSSVDVWNNKLYYSQTLENQFLIQIYSTRYVQ